MSALETAISMLVTNAPPAAHAASAASASARAARQQQGGGGAGEERRRESWRPGDVRRLARKVDAVERMTAAGALHDGWSTASQPRPGSGIGCIGATGVGGAAAVYDLTNTLSLLDNTIRDIDRAISPAGRAHRRRRDDVTSGRRRQPEVVGAAWRLDAVGSGVRQRGDDELDLWSSRRTDAVELDFRRQPGTSTLGHFVFRRETKV